MHQEVTGTKPSYGSFEKYLNNVGIRINGDQPFDVQVSNPQLFREIKMRGSLGAGEAYMDNWWDCEQLDELFNRICSTNLEDKFQSKLLFVFHSLMNLTLNFQTKRRSLSVAEEHYNLGNELYQYMLGETMAYTCGYWKNATTLDQAQYDKFDLICRKLDLKKGERLLDLGCGWGTFAKFAAEKYGCEVVAVNISTEQVKYATEINKELPVKIHLCDYRDDHVYNPDKRPFDKVSSIGLCEHIGHKNYQGFLEIARKNLKDDGLFLLHTIGNKKTTYFTDPWIDKYIFPNGMLPSVDLLINPIENRFVLEDFHNFGADYDKTLMAWHENFMKHWGDLKGTYSDRFYRMWRYYLLSCAGGFRSRTLQLWQFVLSPNGVKGGYESKR